MKEFKSIAKEAKNNTYTKLLKSSQKQLETLDTRIAKIEANPELEKRKQDKNEAVLVIAASFIILGVCNYGLYTINGMNLAAIKSDNFFHSFHIPYFWLFSLGVVIPVVIITLAMKCLYTLSEYLPARKTKAIVHYKTRTLKKLNAYRHSLSNHAERLKTLLNNNQ